MAPVNPVLLKSYLSTRETWMVGNSAVARPGPGGGWVIEQRLLHDGTQLSQVSAGAVLGSRLVLGSPFSRGILVCGA
jgi:hypothetical protein